MRVRRSTTPMGRRILRLELALTLAVIVVLGGIGYYKAVHFEGNQRFSHCTIVSDAILVLDYYYGAGDEVVTSMNPEPGRIVVGIRVHSPGGNRPAIGLSGQAQYILFGSLKDTPIVYEDGRELNCPHTHKMPK
jgi:hypothetical protein